MNVFLNSLRIRRVEFRIAELPILIIPLLLTVTDPAVVRTSVFWEGVLIFFFLFAFGDMINCLADRDLDAVYKKHLSNAVYGLGVGSVKAQIAVSVLAVLLLTAHISWRLNRWSLMALVLCGLALGAAYSVAPVRLKSRGIAGAVCLWLIIFVGPMLLASGIVRPFPSVALMLLAGAYGLLQMGVTLINTAEDYPEDLEAGLKTSVIALGLPQGIAAAWGLSVVGAVGTVGILTALLWREAGASPWLASLLPAVLATAYVAATIGRLSKSLAGVSMDEAIQRVKTSARQVPLWFTINAWSICLAAYGVYRAGRA